MFSKFSAFEVCIDTFLLGILLHLLENHSSSGSEAKSKLQLQEDHKNEVASSPISVCLEYPFDGCLFSFIGVQRVASRANSRIPMEDLRVRGPSC